jgi:hypothetical protein
MLRSCVNHQQVRAMKPSVAPIVTHADAHQRLPGKRATYPRAELQDVPIPLTYDIPIASPAAQRLTC